MRITPAKTNVLTNNSGNVFLFTLLFSVDITAASVSEPGIRCFGNLGAADREILSDIRHRRSQFVYEALETLVLVGALVP